VCFDDKGEIALKNIARPVQVFAVFWREGIEKRQVFARIEGPPLPLPDKPSIAVSAIHQHDR